MKYSYVVLLTVLFLNGCGYHYAKMYSGSELSHDELAVIWDPFKFIRKVDGKSVDPLDSGTVEAMYVAPGRHVLDYYSILDYDFTGLTHTKKYGIVKLEVAFQAGKTYYCEDVRLNHKPIGFECYETPDGFSYPSREDNSVTYERIKSEFEYIKSKGSKIPTKILRE